MVSAPPSVDLFDALILPGLDYRQEIITAAEEATLIETIDDAGLTPFRFQQWTGKRLTRSFGWSYDFATGGFAAAEPIPATLALLRERAGGFAGLDPADLAQALLIRYDPGAGIGWHRDRPHYEHVVGISLGTAATLRFRRREASSFRRASAPLAPRSIYHLSGEARHDWEHSIAPLEHLRWSVTFRSLSDRARKRLGL